MISDKKLQEKIKFKPHLGQRKIINSKKRDIAICAGRRFGKSAISAYVALKALLEADNEKKPAKIWIVAPTYDLTQKVFEYLLKWYLKIAGEKGQRGVSMKPFPHIKTGFGSIVECKSAENPAGLLGEELDLLIVDEAARINRNIWESYLKPTLAIRKGRAFFISTPLGKNWFFEIWTRLGGFQFESRENPLFPDSEWKNAQKTLPHAVFNQEYRALFTEKGASVFSYEDIRAVLNSNFQDAEAGHFYTIGLDLAKMEDFTVISVLDRSGKQVYIDRSQKIPYTRQKNKVIDIASRYNNAKVIIDSLNVGASFGDDLRENGVWVEDFKMAGSISEDWDKRGNKQRLIERLIVAIEGKKVSLIPFREQIDELDTYTCEITLKGNIRYTAPQGMHDDCVDALALAVWGTSFSSSETRNAFKEELKKRTKRTYLKSYI